MAPPLSLQSITKAYGVRPLFERLDLDLQTGERLGIIGPNGSGKSTLMKILAGIETPDSGKRVSARDIRILHVGQEDAFGENDTCESYLASTLKALPEYEREAQVAIALGKAGFEWNEQPVSELSGGWRKRLSLCRMLALEPDVALLDEPTNHLDLEGVRWLEDTLRKYNGTVALISHDRWFLDRVATRVVEIDPRHASGCFYASGGYGDFIIARDLQVAGMLAKQETLANQVKREEEWLRKQPKARTVKSAARVSRAGDLRSELNDLGRRNNINQRAAIDFTATGRRANALIAAEGFCVDRGGRRLVNNLDIDLGPGDRLGLLGGNGSGKSTLMMALGGLLEKSGGSLRHLGNLKVVRFEQDRGRLDPNISLRRTLCPNGDTIEFRNGSVHVVGWAKRFLFRVEQLDQLVGKLSGGEQARLLISMLVREPADVLILDEPTNDLDIPALEVLEEALLDFPGALLMVTHDRWLLDRVCDRLLVLDGSGGCTWVNEFSAWESTQHEKPERGIKNNKGGKDSRGTKSHGRREKSESGLSTKEKRELERIQQTIQNAEASAAAIEVEIADPTLAQDPEAMTKACLRLTKAQRAVEDCYVRWQELEAKACADE